MGDQSRRVNLPGAWEHSANSIQISPDGTLVAELYDFSGNRGGDEAWGIKIAKENQSQLLTHLLQESTFRGHTSEGSAEDQLLQLLPLFSQRFDNYHDFKSWVQERGIPFAEYHDPWA